LNLGDGCAIAAAFFQGEHQPQSSGKPQHALARIRRPRLKVRMRLFRPGAAMIADDQGKLLHFVRCPSGGRREGAKNFLGQLVMGSLPAAASDIAQESGGMENAPRGRIPENGSGFSGR